MKEKIISIKNHVIKVGRLAKEIELIEQHAMTTTEISYKISLARKNLIKSGIFETTAWSKELTDTIFTEIRKQLQLRVRGRK